MKIEVVLSPFQMKDFIDNAIGQGWEEKDSTVCVDTRSNGDLVWLISLRWDGFPE